MKKSLHSAWELILPSEDAYVPRLTPGALTKLSWPRKVEALDQAPEIYRDYLQDLVHQTGVLPDTLYIPTYGWFFWRDAGKLICSLDGEIHILEEEHNHLVVTCYRPEAIHKLDVGMILLQGWLTIHGLTGDGRLSSSTLVFNSVGSFLFTPIIQKIRQAPEDLTGLSGAIPSQTELGKFDYLMRLNFKFMNYARRSILPGEVVMNSLLQPAIQEQVVRFFGRSLSRSLSADHLLILTDRELILLREADLGLWGGETHYGGVWTYLPLHKIQDLEISTRQDGLVNLQVHLPGEDRLEILFSAGKGPEVEALAHQVEGLKARQFTGSEVDGLNV